MKKTGLSLSPAEREALSLIAQAAFVNPFSPERDALDRRIIGASCTEDEALERLLAAVREKIARLERDRRARVDLYAEEDRDLVEKVFLFDIFHRFMNDFDALIQDQVSRGDESLVVPFGSEALALLASRGIAQEKILPYFAVFYQLRRAHYFIHHRIVGSSPCMRRLRMSLWNNVFTHDLAQYERFLAARMEDYSTMLIGETGTGKGTAAVAIGCSGFIPYDDRHHRFVESFTRSFVAINLSQYPATLIESELFGHKKGAFTGAVEAHQGVFARCSPHGAIFLDEIGEIGVPIQIKLLKVLEERIFSPIGSHEKIRFHGRIIVATNQPLLTAREKTGFRDDLFYRLCSDIITLPPLRERLAQDPGELDGLLGSIIRRLLGEPAPALVERVRAAIARDVGAGYAWPGNVRELEQCARRILLTGAYHPDERAGGADANRLVADLAAGALDADQLLARYAALLYRRLGTYGAVAEKLKLDYRTVKKYLSNAESA